MLIPTTDIREFRKYGFKNCKKPYNKCLYLCVAKGNQMIFLSTAMIDIIEWKESDPRIHKNANCRYRDNRTALEIMCELIKNNMVNCDYKEGENNE